MEQRFLENSSKAVAKFLLQRKGLSKQMIGDYLGNLQSSFNQDVLLWGSKLSLDNWINNEWNS